MDALSLNLISGLVGSLVGAFVTIYAVRHQTVLQRESEFRSLLVRQRLRINGQSSEQAGRCVTMEYGDVYGAYQNLLSVYPVWKRLSLRKHWRGYKGDSSDETSLFSHSKFEQTENGARGTVAGFTAEEHIAGVDRLLAYLK